jgi:hypothetical protein
MGGIVFRAIFSGFSTTGGDEDAGKEGGETDRKRANHHPLAARRQTMIRLKNQTRLRRWNVTCRRNVCRALTTGGGEDNRFRSISFSSFFNDFSI